MKSCDAETVRVRVHLGADLIHREVMDAETSFTQKMPTGLDTRRRLSCRDTRDLLDSVDVSHPKS